MVTDENVLLVQSFKELVSKHTLAKVFNEHLLATTSHRAAAAFADGRLGFVMQVPPEHIVTLAPLIASLPSPWRPTHVITDKRLKDAVKVTFSGKSVRVSVERGTK